MYERFIINERLSYQRMEVFMFIGLAMSIDLLRLVLDEVFGKRFSGNEIILAQYESKRIKGRTSFGKVMMTFLLLDNSNR